MAAASWPFFASLVTDDIVASYSMGGAAMGSERHPMTLVAAAASAHAAGDEHAAGLLLDAARDLDDEHPTYYGAAWIALGRILLDTRRLGGCG
jgi:endoglucanase